MFRLEYFACLQAKRDDCYSKQTGSTRSFHGNKQQGEGPVGEGFFLNVVTSRHEVGQ